MKYSSLILHLVFLFILAVHCGPKTPGHFTYIGLPPTVTTNGYTGLGIAKQPQFSWFGIPKYFYPVYVKPPNGRIPSIDTKSPDSRYILASKSQNARKQLGKAVGSGVQCKKGYVKHIFGGCVKPRRRYQKFQKY